MAYEDVLGWLLTYLLQSTALLLSAWLISRCLGPGRLAAREFVWRLALVGGLLTASAQQALHWEPIGGALHFDVLAIETAEPTGRQVASFLLADTQGVTHHTPDAKTLSPGLAKAPEDSGLARVLVAGWILIGVGWLSRLVIGFLWLRLRLNGRVPLLRGRLFELFRRLAFSAGVGEKVELSSSDQIRVPLARGFRRGEVCVPERVREELDQESQETVLAHELAHLKRRDPMWLLVARVVESALFVQPLNFLARRELQSIAELRCDDWAVEHTGKPVTLAKCLTQVAEWGLERQYAAASLSMAGSGSQLGQRVRRLLDRGYPRPDGGVPMWIRYGVPIFLAVVAVMAPRVSGAAAAGPEPPAIVAKAPAAEAPQAAPPKSPAPARPAMPPPAIASAAPSVRAEPAAVVAPAMAPVATGRAVPAPAAAPRPVPRPLLPEIAVAPELGPVIEQIASLEMEVHLEQLELEREAATLAEAAELGMVAGLDMAALDEEMKLVAAELRRASERLELVETERIEGLSESEMARDRVREEVDRQAARHEAELRRVEERLDRRAESMIDPERQRRIEEEMEARMARSALRMELMAEERALALKQLEESLPPVEERIRLVDEARRYADQMRPSREEMRLLSEEVRAEIERSRSQLAAQMQLQEQVRLEMEELRLKLRSDLRLLVEELRAAREESP